MYTIWLAARYLAALLPGGEIDEFMGQAGW